MQYTLHQSSHIHRRRANIPVQRSSMHIHLGLHIPIPSLKQPDPPPGRIHGPVAVVGGGVDVVEEIPD